MKSKASSSQARSGAQLEKDVAAALAWLKKNSSAKVRDGMARYGLPSDKALGVPVGTIQKLGKQLGKDHELATALWTTDVYEARLLVSFIGEPEKLTVAQMDRWCRDFDNWGVVDTVCFALFDRSPLAWKRVEPWAKLKGEFQKRAGFVLLACLAAHAEGIPDQQFIRYLPLVEWGATDERNFVKKGVSWALRMIGLQSPGLRTACTASANRLVSSDNPTARWVGKEALREFAKKR